MKSSGTEEELPALPDAPAVVEDPVPPNDEPETPKAPPGILQTTSKRDRNAKFLSFESFKTPFNIRIKAANEVQSLLPGSVPGSEPQSEHSIGVSLAPSSGRSLALRNPTGRRSIAFNAPRAGDLANPFTSSFVKVLRPDLRDDGKLQINCMATSGDGRIIVTGGSLVADGRVSGAIHIWSRSVETMDMGQWHCWDVEPAEEYHLSTVTCLSFEGNTLVSGHMPPDGLRRFDASSKTLGNSFNMHGSSPVQSADICVWRLDVPGEDLELRLRQQSPDGVLTAAKVLLARRQGAALRLVTVSGGTVTLWRELGEELCTQMEPVFSFRAHADKTLSIAYLPRVFGTAETAPDLLATASNDKTAVIWQLQDNEMSLVHKLPHPREVYAADFYGGDDFDPDTEYVATTSHDLSLRLWHVSSGICIHVIKHNHPVMAVDYVETGEMIATGTQSGEVAIFDAMTGIRMRTMKGHNQEIVAVKFLPDCNLLASTSKDGSLRVWEVMSTTESVHKIGERSMAVGCGGGHGKTVYSIDISVDGEMLATASRDHTVKLWNTCSGRLVAVLEGHTNFVFKVAFHPTAHQCATASHDWSIRMWCTITGNCLQTIAYDPERIFEGDEEEEEEDSMASMFHSAEVSAVAFHPDGTILASASYDKKVILYAEEPSGDKMQWEPFLVLGDHTERIWDLRFSWEGDYLVSAAWDNMVHIYKTEHLTSGDTEEPPTPQTRRSSAVSSGGGPHFVGNLASRLGIVADSPFRTPYKQAENIMAEDLDYKSASLNCLAKVWTVAFQPQRAQPLLITGAADHSIRVWGAQYGNLWKQQAVLEGHTNTVTGVAWHPEGHMFVSSSFDKTVRLWVEKGLGYDGKTVKFQAAGLWSAYSWPSMAVAWAYQPNRHFMASHIGSSMISIATLDGSAYLMDASDAGQHFIAHARAQHVLKQGEGFAREMMLDMVRSSPQTLVSLGNKSEVLMHSVMNECDDLKLAKRMLDLYGENELTPLLPYGPKGVPLLASVNNFHGVAAIVDCVVEMGKEAASRNAAAMATGRGTCVILMLIERYPDQAVRLLRHIGMVQANDVVYDPKWNRRRRMAHDGMIPHQCNNFDAGRTRYPKALWGSEKKATTFLAKLTNFLYLETETEPTDVIAMHSAYPYVAGLLPQEYTLDTATRNMVTSFMGSPGAKWDKAANDYSLLEKSFLHLAYASNEPHLFETPLGRAVLTFKWESYGQRVLITQAAVFLVQLMAVTMQAFALGRMNHAGGWLTAEERQTWSLAALILAALVLLCSLVQAAYEVLQIRAEGFRLYLGDFWSVLDVLCLLLGASAASLGMIQTFHAGLQDSSATEAVSSVACFLSWIKVMYFLRAFPSTGGLVRMVVQIGYDMRYLLVILVVVLMGAASSFFVLMTINYTPEDCEWEGEWDEITEKDLGQLEDCVAPLSFWGMMMNVFGMMLGSFDLDSFDSLGNYQLLGQVLFILYMGFQMILLLNLLIALMGDSYEKVQEKAKTEALRERAGLLVEIELVMGQRYLERNNYCPRWLHTLVPKETVQTGDSRRTKEWAGITGTIRSDMEGQVAALRAQFRDEMQKNTEALLTTLQGGIGEQLKSLREELINHPRFRSTMQETPGKSPFRGRRMTQKLPTTVQRQVHQG